MVISFCGSARSKLALVLLVALSVSACAAARPSGQAPVEGAYFIAPVFPGDSIVTFAERYGVKADDVLALNRIKNRNRLTWGQLRVPAHGVAREGRPVPAVQSTPVVQSAVMTAPRAPVPQPRPASIETRSLAPLSTPSARNASVKTNGLDTAARPPAGERVASLPPQNSTAEANWYDWLMPSPPLPAEGDVAPHFLWPVEGRVISPYGTSPDGGRNDGINISAERGAPIHAAEAGEVSYVGNELKSYGNLILIRHDNGFVTAYAHADGVHVKRGEHVERGQVIGSAGDTGDVSEVQVHFELRNGTRPVDPTPYLVAPERAPIPVADSTERLAEGAR